eukprot:2469241-Rhodomonas_salina.1
MPRTARAQAGRLVDLGGGGLSAENLASGSGARRGEEVGRGLALHPEHSHRVLPHQLLLPLLCRRRLLLDLLSCLLHPDA